MHLLLLLVHDGTVGSEPDARATGMIKENIGLNQLVGVCLVDTD